MERLEDLYRWFDHEAKRIRPKLPKYSVGIVGLGRVGKATWHSILRVDRVDPIYLFSTDLEKARGLLKDYNDIKLIQSKRYHELQDELDNLDIIIVTVDKSGYLEKLADITWEETLDANLDLLVGTAQQLQGFKGHVIVVTNPVDISTYIIASHSEIAPEYITGFSHIDLERWRGILYDEFFRPHGLEPHLVDELSIEVVGPHRYTLKGEQCVYIFRDLGGLRRHIIMRDETTYNALRNKAIFKARELMRIGERYGLGTEWGTARALMKVLDAMINEDEDKYVRTCTFLEPQLLGIDGVLPLMIFGYSTRFKRTQSKRIAAIPKTEFVIEEDSDFEKVVREYHSLESKIIRMRESGAIPRYVERGGIQEIVGVEKERVEIRPKLIHKPFDLDTMVVAACGNNIIEWDDLNNPNQRKIQEFKGEEFERGIHSFIVEDIEGEKFYFLGHKQGITMKNPLTGEEVLFKYKSDRSIRSIVVASINNEWYLFGGNAYKGFMFDINKPNKVEQEFSGFFGDLNAIEVAEIEDKLYVFVASKGVYQYSPDKGDPIHVFEVEGVYNDITDLKLFEEKLYGSNLSRILRYDTKILGQAPREFGHVHGTNISCLDIVDVKARDFVIVGTLNPEVYRFRLTTGEITDIYEKKRDNLNGTGKVDVARIGRLDCLLASDKSITRTTRQAGITIWNIANPDVPMSFLTTNQDHSIRGFGVLRKDG